MPAPKHSKALISNAIAAAKAAGLTPTAIHLGADGSLTIDIEAKEINPAADQTVAPIKSNEPPRYGQ